MSASSRVAIECDGPFCVEEVVGEQNETLNDLRIRAASDLGWWHEYDDRYGMRDFCGN